MKRLLIIALAGMPLWASAQSLERSVVASAGSFQFAGTLSHSFTIGEPVITTLTTGSLVLTQGFQQPSAMPTAVEEAESADFSVVAYPNPVISVLTLDIQNAAFESLWLTMLDMSGKLVLSDIVNVSTGLNRHTLNVAALSSGLYFIRVMHTESGGAQILKFIKTD